MSEYALRSMKKFMQAVAFFLSLCPGLGFFSSSKNTFLYFYMVVGDTDGGKVRLLINRQH